MSASVNTCYGYLVYIWPTDIPWLIFTDERDGKTDPHIPIVGVELLPNVVYHL